MPLHCSRVLSQLVEFIHSGHQRHYYDQLRASVPRFSLIQGQQRLCFHLGGDSCSSKSLFTLDLSAFTQILVAIYRFRCRMSNTKISPQLATLDGPVIASSVLCRENFCAYGMKFCIGGRIECLTITGLRLDKSTHGTGQSGASSRGFESGDSNLSKLIVVFATMQLTRPGLSSRPVMPIPLAINLCIFEARNELT
jgi:hypothetical protein